MVFLEFMISFVGDLVNRYIHLTCFQGADTFRVLPHPKCKAKEPNNSECGLGKTWDSVCFLGARFHIFSNLKNMFLIHSKDF
jgi:hypothetical protein